jgi:aspartyl-tRNA(Asn)/glutamyl-tRNA(Gln) amidotransferase subunit A
MLAEACQGIPTEGMPSSDLLYRSATDLAGLIRRRLVSPVELVGQVLHRIDTLQPSLNAFITILADRARADARRAEEAVMRGDPLGALHGIPFSVKDLTHPADVRTTMGSAIFENFIPTEDAVPVARMKQAGAILIGKTTTPEFGHKPITESPLFGNTPNPWDPTRTCGGSSGGAAVAVSSGMGPLALGTDGGGSIRIPASCCGIVGLKPTLGVVPHIHAPDLFGNYSYIGPMTRTVADASLVMDVIAGADPGDPYALSAPAARPALGDTLAGVRIGWMPTVGNRIDPETLAAAARAVRMLGDLGAKIDPLENDDFVSVEHHFLVMLQSGLRARLARYVSDYATRIAPSLLQTIEHGAKWNAVDLQRALVARSDLFRRFQRLFETYDLLVSPTLSAPALPLDQDPFERITISGVDAGTIRGAWYPYTYPTNLTGNPAISIPCGWSAAGLPIGFQIIGPWHAETTLLDVASRLEAQLQWGERWPPFAEVGP